MLKPTSFERKARGPGRELTGWSSPQGIFSGPGHLTTRGSLLLLGPHTSVSWVGISHRHPPPPSPSCFLLCPNHSCSPLRFPWFPTILWMHFLFFQQDGKNLEGKGNTLALSSQSSQCTWNSISPCQLMDMCQGPSWCHFNVTFPCQQGPRGHPLPHPPPSFLHLPFPYFRSSTS